MQRKKMFRLGGALPIALILVLLSVVNVAAAPPPNDERSGAFLVAVPFSGSMDTTDATSNATDPDCAGQDSHSVWFLFKPTETRSYTFSTDASDYDTTLSVWQAATFGGRFGTYDGGRSGLTQVGCNDDTDNSVQSELTVTLTAGKNYWIMVGGYFSSSAGTLNLSGS